MKAIYSLEIYGCFCCRIPKKNGKGYLKAALGFHHANDDSRKLHDELRELGLEQRDICDIDGYLMLPQPTNLFGADRENDAKLLMKALSAVFPRITEWEEVDYLIVAKIN